MMEGEKIEVEFEEDVPAVYLVIARPNKEGLERRCFVDGKHVGRIPFWTALGNSANSRAVDNVIDITPDRTGHQVTPTDTHD